jgi:Domain of unknown function (DUF1906)
MRNFFVLVFSLLLIVGAQAAPSCNTQEGMTAADLSQPVTSITTKSGKSGADAFKVIGVKTIARYLDWPEDGIISCKVLLPVESDTIIKAGLSIVTVYQHENDDPETFMKPGRGREDAVKAVKLARANGQPVGSAIYFAVDGVDQSIKDSVFEYAVNKGGPVSKGRRHRLISADRTFRKHIKHYERFRHYHKNIFNKSAENIHASDILPLVERYFRDVRAGMGESKAGYKIGAYGSGATCRHLQKHGLIDYCWLAMSTGWPGFDAQYKSGNWHLAQQRSTSCKNWKFRESEKVHFDFNKVNGAKINYGQWSKKAEITPLPLLPTSCTLRW